MEKELTSLRTQNEELKKSSAVHDCQVKEPSGIDMGPNNEALVEEGKVFELKSEKKV